METKYLREVYSNTIKKQEGAQIIKHDNLINYIKTNIIKTQLKEGNNKN